MVTMYKIEHLTILFIIQQTVKFCHPRLKVVYYQQPSRSAEVNGQGAIHLVLWRKSFICFSSWGGDPESQGANR